MSRRFKELDGTLSNVASRIVSDYQDAGHSCCMEVGKHAERVLKVKLKRPQMVSLGFTEDKLTKSLGTVSFSDENALMNIFYELEDRICVPCGMDFPEKASWDERDEHIKKNKDKIMFMNDYDDRLTFNRKANREYKAYLESQGEPTTYKSMWDDREFDRELNHTYFTCFNHKVRNNFLTNTKGNGLGGMKPSRFLSKYVDQFIPGISDRYSAALSCTKEVEVYLTIDPNIMINCSEAATFSSCFRFDGEYHYSAQRFTNGEDTLMAVVFDSEGRICYRNWVFVNIDSDKIINFTPYADINPTVIGSAVNKAVNTHVLGADTYTTQYVGDTDIEANVDEDITYLDQHHVSFIGDEDTEVDTWNNGCSMFDFGEAINLNDGCFTDYRELSEGSTCDHCGDHEHDFTYIEGHGDICAHCLEHNFHWISSESEYYHDNDVTEDVHGNYFLDIYRDNGYIQHDDSGEWYPDAELVRAYDNDFYYEPADLHYSEVTQEYFYDEDVMKEEEAKHAEGVA